MLAINAVQYLIRITTFAKRGIYSISLLDVLNEGNKIFWIYIRRDLYKRKNSKDIINYKGW